MYSQIADNKRKTVLIFMGFLLLVGGLAWLFGRVSGRPSFTLAAIIGGGLYALFSYFASAKIALAVNGAREISKKDNPRLWRIIENLSITDGLPMPKVYLIDDQAPNAFATGRDPNHSAVAVTAGLLEIMNNDELQGVIAHELGHVKNYDIRVSLVAFALVSVIGLLADLMWRVRWFGRSDNRSEEGQILLVLSIVAAILAPFVAMLIQLAISRKREYLADATGALTTRYPEGLVSALEKLKTYGRPLRRQNTSTAHFFIVNPLRGKTVATLFSTHPPLDDRIKALRAMESHA